MAASSPAARSEYLGRYGEAGDSVAEEDRARAATMSVSAALSLGPRTAGHQHNDAKYSGGQPAT
jgi:hypothetical protein